MARGSSWGKSAFIFRFSHVSVPAQINSRGRAAWHKTNCRTSQREVHTVDCVVLKMDLKSLLRCCFVLFCGQNFSLGCQWIRYRYKDVSRDNLQLLANMGGEFVREKVNIPFPNKVYSNAKHSQMGDSISILYEAIRQIRKLYSKDMNSVTWDSVKLDRFQSNLHRTTSELEQCKREITYSDSTGSHGKENRSLKRHFKKLEHYLKTKDYSANAWEVVRTEVWKHLQRLDLLTTAMRTGTNA